MKATKVDSEQPRQPETSDPSFRLDERTSALFEDDNLAGEQYRRVYSKRLLSPEQDLMTAVLDEAIADYQRYANGRSKRSVRRFTEVEAWFLRDDTEWVFSYVNCCEVLGIEPAYLRRGMLRYGGNKLPETPALPFRAMSKRIIKKRLRHAA
jgi:hypothetical protein